MVDCLFGCGFGEWLVGWVRWLDVWLIGYFGVDVVIGYLGVNLTVGWMALTLFRLVLQILSRIF